MRLWVRSTRYEFDFDAVLRSECELHDRSYLLKGAQRVYFESAQQVGEQHFLLHLRKTLANAVASAGRKRYVRVRMARLVVVVF